MANESQLDPKLWNVLESPLTFLREKLQLTDMQIVFLAMLADSDTPMTWKDFSDFLDCSRLKVMAFAAIDQIYPNDFTCDTMRRMLVDGCHPLMDLGYIEHKCDEGHADPHLYVLTSKFKDEYLAGYTPHNILMR